MLTIDYFDYWTSLVSDITCLSFGFCESADVRADDIATGVSGTRFHVARGEARASSFRCHWSAYTMYVMPAQRQQWRMRWVSRLDDIRAGLEDVSPVCWPPATRQWRARRDTV